MLVAFSARFSSWLIIHALLARHQTAHKEVFIYLRIVLHD